MIAVLLLIYGTSSSALRKQFGIQHFLPKSARDRLKTQEALVDVITRSFKNFENMSDENAGIRYAEIVERLPSYEVHRFKMNLVSAADCTKHVNSVCCECCICCL